jgi:hypothetical protein
MSSRTAAIVCIIVTAAVAFAGCASSRGHQMTPSGYTSDPNFPDGWTSTPPSDSASGGLLQGLGYASMNDWNFRK